MGAYIINVPDTVDTIIYVNIGDVYDGKTYIASQRVEDLTPYTEPDLEQVREEAYQQGYETAKHECEDCTKPLDNGKAYQQGLTDAWEVARKFMSEVMDARFRNNFMVEIFECDNAMGAMKVYSASEAIEKIRQYEQGKEEIQVGDEVKLKCGVSPAIYMQGTNGSDEIYLLFNDGSCGIHGRDEIECKTGRHFHEIAEVLQKMRES